MLTGIALLAGKRLTPEGHVGLRHLEGETPENFAPGMGREAELRAGSTTQTCLLQRGSTCGGSPPPPFQAVTAAVRSYQPNILNISLGTTFYLIERKIKMTCSWRVNISAEMGGTHAS